jgi:hypothetical protein
MNHDSDENRNDQEDSDGDRIKNPLERHRKLKQKTPTTTTSTTAMHNNPLPPPTSTDAIPSPRGDSDGATTTNMRHANTTTADETSKSTASPIPSVPPVEPSPPPPPPQPSTPKPIKLIKSTRLKGYMTLTLAAFINLDAARTSSNIDTNAITIVPSTDQQRLYAQITAIISLIGTTICCLIHFDRITPLQNKVWIPILFHTNGTSVYEGCIIIFYTLWWGISTGIATSVNGIAGDGKGQYSLYYSNWACCLTSFWLLDRWFVASGWVRYLNLHF